MIIIIIIIIKVIASNTFITIKDSTSRTRNILLSQFGIILKQNYEENYHFYLSTQLVVT